jgi:uncharacterized protein with PIN domain
MAQTRPRFLLTANLNKLAKWLRLLGYDAALYKNISFSAMINLAAKERRKILTRARKQQNDKHKDIILIRSEDHLNQLREINKLLVMNDDYLFTRCLICNKMLYEIERQNIKKLVPEYIYKTHSDFKVCRKCGRLYWQGTHYEKMLETLKEIFNQK